MSHSFCSACPWSLLPLGLFLLVLVRTEAVLIDETPVELLAFSWQMRQPGSNGGTHWTSRHS